VKENRDCDSKIIQFSFQLLQFESNQICFDRLSDDCFSEIKIKIKIKIKK